MMNDSNRPPEAGSKNRHPDLVAVDPASRKGLFRRHWGKTLLLALFGIPVLGGALWTGVVLTYSYSEGTRTGYVQKLSRKGWICKTWEGELAMATAPGVSPQIFAFTIRDNSVANAMTKDLGKGRMAVRYEEHRGVPTSCFGDTPYFVVGYELQRDEGQPPVP